MKNELFSQIPEYLPIGVIFYDKDGYLKYLNKVALNMFGATEQTAYDLNIFEDPNISPEDKLRLKKGLNVSFETDYDFDRCHEEFFKTIIKKVRKYFVTKVTIMHDNDGNTRGFLLNCEDITEKKVQEREIIESYRKIKSTQRELSLALNAGNLRSWNYRIQEGMFYKFSDKVEIGEEWSFESICDTIHPDDKERFFALLDTILDKKGLTDNTISLRVIYDGETDYRHYNFVYNVLENEQGTVVGITFIQRDITDDIIYQQNLISAKEKAEEADKLKSTFLATMSHEIRTPLNAIVGFSQLISETTEIEEKNEYKQMIETNSEILLKLIGDILDLSKIEAGSIDIDRQPLDLTQLCGELYQSFKQRLKNPDVTLRFIDPYAKCIAKLDRHRFIQIFTNFVTNAIKYTPKGEITMGYECHPGRIRFYVRDSGIGIPEQKKSRIFSKFEKLDDFAQGTGLGLSICKAIADATAGEIGFESDVNKGSEFWYVGHTEIEFVEKAQSSTQETHSEHTCQKTEFCTLNTPKLRILVAEDNDSNYLLLKSILKDNFLTRATTGVEAVEKAKNQNFDVILMDIKMPEMNGLEATSLIRQFNTAIPIIALTANAFNADKDAALTAGCNHFITKPIKKQELMELLTMIS